MLQKYKAELVESDKAMKLYFECLYNVCITLLMNLYVILINLV